MAKTWKTVLIYQIMEREIARCARAYLRGRLIDIGCGTQPYRRQVLPSITEYVGLDRASPFNKQARVDLVGSAYKIPADPCSFDSAMSHATLEHLSDPEDALRECHRVLKPGGHAVYTVPFIWQLHSEPWDYFRYSKYGLQHLFEKTGFEIVEIQPMAGFWVTAATMACYYIERFMVGPLRRIPVIPAVGLCLQGVAYVFQGVDPAPQWTWMYTVVARRK